LAGDVDAAHRDLVEAHIEAIASTCSNPTEPSAPSPDVPEALVVEPEAPVVGPVAPEPGPAAPDPEGSRAEPGAERNGARSEARSAGGSGSFALSAAGGLAYFDIGDVVTPLVVRAHVRAGYSLSVGAFEIGVALSGALSPMSFKSNAGNGTALFTQVLGSPFLGWSSGRWHLRVEVGGGLGIVSGLGDGNPFTVDASSAPALVSLALRVAASVEIDLLPSLALHLTPVEITWSSGHDTLSTDIDAIMSYAVLLGVRARFNP
jgi:hypothetical protein